MENPHKLRLSDCMDPKVYNPHGFPSLDHHRHHTGNHDISLLESSGFYTTNHVDNFHEIEAKVEKSSSSSSLSSSPSSSSSSSSSRRKMDVRLMMLVEFFRQLYLQRRELLYNLLPGVLQNEFAELFEKFGKTVSPERGNDDRAAVTTSQLKRSLSVGSPSLRPERFKVRTVEAGDIQDGGKSKPPADPKK